MKRLGLGLIVIFIATLSACGYAEEVETFMHVHGLEYDQEGSGFYLATHHGLIQVDESGWNQVGEEAEHHDFMGFTMLEDGTMISSGHPSIRSKLENPLGVMISENKGQSWEPIALHGDVDFHVLHVNLGNENMMYGIDSYNSMLYKTKNGGYDWEQVEIDGLPVTAGDIYALASHPQNPEYLLASTEVGIYTSENGGETWTEYDNRLMVTSFQTVNESEKLFAYLLGEKEGLHVSEDFGHSWKPLHLKLHEDVVTYIAVHPKDERKLIVGTAGQSIYQTEDFGESWERLATEGVIHH
ncbi:hypothetical protein N0O92_15360 [Alkalihalobacillus sp. MEB130]|uniref:F510_1955 family glycosylhydrolase n=1 Tax=Alkalihalobacillus sp. MEB130 TaxID=2976704 RepID=UPI0028DFDC1B|nr:hypothetical protein [Alkalihalobacillus sp. MEB130]MDT8861595.1 hypothetical protein [Alkalihalobacillus sp. MEB130]